MSSVKDLAKYIVVVFQIDGSDVLYNCVIYDGHTRKKYKITWADCKKDIFAFDNLTEMKERLNQAFDGDPDRYVFNWGERSDTGRFGYAYILPRPEEEES